MKNNYADVGRIIEEKTHSNAIHSDPSLAVLAQGR